ncbi:MAG: response regulator [bacterium]|nr:response regulator [bacterium]
MEQPPSLLVVDDESDVRESLEDYFTANDFMVHTAAEGKEMRAIMARERVDCVLLDLRIPGDDGFALCRFLRESYQVGVIMLTGSSETVDKVVGLELGADDDVAKPSEPRELLARVRSVLRRTSATPATTAAGQTHFAFGPAQIDIARRRVTLANGEARKLTTAEMDLLVAFVERPGRVLSRDFLLEVVNRRTSDPFDRSIDVRVTRLRKKVEPDPQEPKLIVTVRGEGYFYDPKGADEDV